MISDILLLPCSKDYGVKVKMQPNHFIDSKEILIILYLAETVFYYL